MTAACQSEDIKEARLAFIEKRKHTSSAASARQSPLSRRDPHNWLTLNLIDASAPLAAKARRDGS